MIDFFATIGVAAIVVTIPLAIWKGLEIHFEYEGVRDKVNILWEYHNQGRWGRAEQKNVGKEEE